VYSKLPIASSALYGVVCGQKAGYEPFNTLTLDIKTHDFCLHFNGRDPVCQCERICT
jgi:hypothetical protein